MAAIYGTFLIVLTSFHHFVQGCDANILQFPRMCNLRP